MKPELLPTSPQPIVPDTWLTAKDPMVVEVYIRSRAYRDFYAPHATVQRPGRKARPSIPEPR